MPAPLLPIVMIKAPAPGRVKTRLIDGGLTGDHAAQIAAALARCIVSRLLLRGRVALALDSDATLEQLAITGGSGDAGGRGSDLLITHQGEGDLGQRIHRVWSALSPHEPVAFFGIDSPDIPAAALDSITSALATTDAAIGPTHDGGYWTLAANHIQPALLNGIDWGQPVVYDQTVRNARTAGIRLATLPPWHDVDRPADLRTLIDRLNTVQPSGADRTATDDVRILTDLRTQLLDILPPACLPHD